MTELARGLAGFARLAASQVAFLLCLVAFFVAPAWAGDEVRLAQLPPEARQTLALIKQGGPYPYAKDHSVFHNREGRLPLQYKGYYREYTVPTPGLTHRGARRIVAGAMGDYWYTGDHYRTFQRIRE